MTKANQIFKRDFAIITCTHCFNRFRTCTKFPSYLKDRVENGCKVCGKKHYYVMWKLWANESEKLEQSVVPEDLKEAYVLLAHKQNIQDKLDRLFSGVEKWIVDADLKQDVKAKGQIRRKITQAKKWLNIPYREEDTEEEHDGV